MYTDRYPALVDSLLAAGFVLAWSSGFIGATLGTRAAGVLTLLMWRFLIVAPLLVAWSVRRATRRLSGRDLLLQSVIGLLSQGVYLGGTILAVGLGVGAGTVAMIAALQPVTAAALAGPVLGERVAGRQWLGLAIGLVGVTVVVGGDLGTGGTAPAWAYLLPFAGMAGLVAATLLAQRVPSAASLSQGLAVQCVVSAVLFTVLAAALGDARPPGDAGFWAAVAWVIVLSTVGGYGLYWLNLRRGSVARVSSLIYLTPPTTLVWALVMFGDAITATTLAGLTVCLAGVLIVRRRAPIPACPPARPATS